jgi:LPXTG-motif cell wall-anchored protein
MHPLRIRKRIPLALGLAAAVALVPGTAFAHHPEVTVDQDCGGTLTWRAEAWANSDADRRVNHKVEVRIFGEGLPKDGKVIKIGRFDEANGYRFSGTYELPEPEDIEIKATSLVKWGEDQKYGDLNEFRTDEVGVDDAEDDDCDDEDATTGTTVLEPPTAAPVVTTAPDPVDGAVTDQPQVVSPAVADAEQLPFTGSNTVPLMIGGLVLLAAGLTLLRRGRHQPRHSND